jgi:CheY-like chemotaxis protein
MRVEKKILVVDDTLISRKGTTFLLKSIGFESDEAEDGRAAIELVKNAKYAAILMDCHMPEIDGFECTVKIRELERTTGSRIPIIAFTAHKSEDLRARAMRSGMDDLLEKECTTEELHQTLSRIID